MPTLLVSTTKPQPWVGELHSPSPLPFSKLWLVSPLFLTAIKPIHFFKLFLLLLNFLPFLLGVMMQRLMPLNSISSTSALQPSVASPQLLKIALCKKLKTSNSSSLTRLCLLLLTPFFNYRNR